MNEGADRAERAAERTEISERAEKVEVAEGTERPERTRKAPLPCRRKTSLRHSCFQRMRTTTQCTAFAANPSVHWISL